MPTSRPALSIVITNYNHHEFLAQALDALLVQSFTDFELIIIDDGSTDESPALLQQYAAKDSRIRLILHSENRGVIFRTNELVRLAKGPYIHQHAADDYRLPGFLQILMERLQADPSLGAAMTTYYCEKNDVYTEGARLFTEPTCVHPEQLCAHLLTDPFALSGIASILKTELIIQHGPLRENLLHLSDWFLNHLIFFSHKIFVVPQPLAVFRIGNNYSLACQHTKKSRQLAYRALLQALHEPKHRFFYVYVRKNGLLWFVFQEFFWRMLLNPRYWRFWPAVHKKYPIHKRLKKSLLKKLGYLGIKPSKKSFAT